MKKILVKNQVEGGKVAFDLLKESLAAGAQTLGLATGSSPIALYQEMVESDVDFSELYSVNLDEYVGLAPDHEQSYHAFMKAQLFDAKPFKESFLPDGMAEDLEQAAKDYDDVLAHHAIDLQILGIGSNGHIGFNEPGTPFDSQTHVVDLTDSTIEANSRFLPVLTKSLQRLFRWGLLPLWLPRRLSCLPMVTRKQTPFSRWSRGQ